MDLEPIIDEFKSRAAVVPSTTPPPENPPNEVDSDPVQDPIQVLDNLNLNVDCLPPSILGSLANEFPDDPMTNVGNEEDESPPEITS